MLILYNILSQNRIQPSQLKRIYGSLTSSQRRAIQTKRTYKQRMQSLCGLLLIQHGMHLLGFKDFNLTNILRQQNGKPVTQYPAFFNISHSATLVTCVLSTRQAVAIDIEKNRSIQQRVLTRYLDNKPSTLSPMQAWVAKESVIKLFDEANLKDVPEIKLSDTTAHFNDQSCYIKYSNLINGYTCAVSSTHIIRHIAKQQMIFK